MNRLWVENEVDMIKTLSRRTCVRAPVSVAGTNWVIRALCYVGNLWVAACFLFYSTTAANVRWQLRASAEQGKKVWGCLLPKNSHHIRVLITKTVLSRWKGGCDCRPAAGSHPPLGFSVGFPFPNSQKTCRWEPFSGPSGGFKTLTQSNCNAPGSGCMSPLISLSSLPITSVLSLYLLQAKEPEI